MVPSTHHCGPRSRAPRRRKYREVEASEEPWEFPHSRAPFLKLKRLKPEKKKTFLLKNLCKRVVEVFEKQERVADFWERVVGNQSMKLRHLHEISMFSTFCRCHGATVRGKDPFLTATVE